jgi:hypothetical protein
MPVVSLRAHYDGTAIRLDEPYDLPPDAQLLVTVLSPTTDADEKAAFAALAAEGLTRADGKKEPEYSSADIVP